MPTAAGDDLVEGGPAYEVMYLLEADDEHVPPLRTTLDGLGDSLVVVGGDRLWNVHVHVDDVGAAIEAGIAAGRPYRIAVTHFADQMRPAAHGRGARGSSSPPPPATGSPTCAARPGPRCSSSPAPSRSSSTGCAPRSSSAGADEVVVLPEQLRLRRALRGRRPGGRQDGIRVAVIPTSAQVQGLAALAVHDPGLGFDEDVVAMSSAAAHTQHGAVTVATEPGMTMAGPCEAGDVLGVVAGDFAVRRLRPRPRGPRRRRPAAVAGRRDADPGHRRRRRSRARRAGRAHVSDQRVDVEVVVYDGGQEHYPLFVAVE